MLALIESPDIGESGLSAALPYVLLDLGQHVLRILIAGVQPQRPVVVLLRQLVVTGLQVPFGQTVSATSDTRFEWTTTMSWERSRGAFDASADLVGYPSENPYHLESEHHDGEHRVRGTRPPREGSSTGTSQPPDRD